MRSALLSIAFFSALLSPAQAATGLRTAAVPPAAPHRQLQSFQRMTFHGVTSIGKLTGPRWQLAPPPRTDHFRFGQRGYRASDVHPNAPRPALGRLAAVGPVAVPAAYPRGIVGPDPGFVGNAGLTNYDQATAGTGVYTNTQFTLEPPDQALCVGNGFVVEAVNNAIAVSTQFGAPLTAPTPLSAFFGLDPEFIAPSGPIGPFISDPKCYFDRATQRWFVTELEIDDNPTTGAFENRSAVYVAISQTSSPLSPFNVLSFDTTDPGNPGCPCFGDQPLIGADAAGFFISVNEFSLNAPTFNGAQIYAFSKLALALGNIPTVVHLDAGALPTPDAGGLWYSIQPATSPETGAAEPRNGTEYFLSSLDFFNKNDNRIATWALTNTASLYDRTPRVALQNTVVRTEAYGLPPPATQKAGPTPLGTSVHDPLELLNTNDDRMNQVVFSRGQLWSGVNTVATVDGRTQAAIAFFSIVPSLRSQALAANVAYQGYVATGGQNTLFPSIGVNANGVAELVCTLSGPNYFPSIAYVPLNAFRQNLRLAARGTAPEDGFTGYKAFGGAGVARWGDYSAAVSDARGNIWIAGEYIPNAPRTKFANWGTFVGAIASNNGGIGTPTR